MTTSRKMFQGRITIPGNQATSLVALMAASPLHWTLEADLTTPSLDSILGSEVGLIPDGVIYVGSDANVKNATADPYYQGIRINGGQNYSLQDFGGGYGMIDPNQIYLYSASGSGADLVFQAR